MYETILSYGLVGDFFLMIVGMTVLIGGGDILIRGASRLATALRISPLVVGLTVVAFCTSSPELAVSLNAALSGKADMAVGNVIGSNICNICLILGIAALMRPLAVSSMLIRREIPFLIVLSFLVYGFAISGGEGFFSLFEGDYDGHIARLEGAVLTTGLAAYLFWTIYEVRRHRDRNEQYAKEIEEEILSSISEQKTKIAGSSNMIVNLSYLIIGIALLVAGSDMLVQGGVGAARSFDISELVVGLTILAAGTSLPELAVSILAATRGKQDIAVGNVIGSNIFNILGVLGPTALLSADGLVVTAKALQFDLPFMLLISICCIAIGVTGKRISRGEGFFLLLCYAAYIAFLCLAET